MTTLCISGKRAAIVGAAAALPFAMALFASAAPTQTKPAPSARLQYNRDIRPILAENCFPCHGPDSAARKAGLRLDRFADATLVTNGHSAIVKGNPAASEMVRRITAQGPQMPPPTTKKVLTPHQIALLKRWISEGAEYEKHWSLLAPTRSALPVVKDTAWVRNPIDRFILARLEKVGLKPAPEADRRTLARRVSLDLTGLPPEPADVEAFVNDKSPDAYEKLVDKLMATPQWGEHRGRYWLDAARYGDTHGIHMDFYREMWSYRDWVINAFNRNMPFDQFTVEQLAGDLIADQHGKSGSWDAAYAKEYPYFTVMESPLDTRIGSGFNRCNITSNEGGMISDEYLVLYARDRTETTSAVWLGSTLNCAVCHDHKFDPWTQKDFYSLSAMFNNTTQGAGDGNIKDTPPVIAVPLEKDRPRLEAITTELATAKKQVDERKQAARGDYDKWVTAATYAPILNTVPSDGLVFHAPLTEGQGKEVEVFVGGKSTKLTATGNVAWPAGHVAARAFQRMNDGSVAIPNAGDFERDQKFTASAWVKIPKADQGGAVMARMDNANGYRGWDLWMEGGKIGTHIISKFPEDALKVVSREQISPKVWHHVAITYSGGANPDSVKVYIDGAQKDFDIQTNTLKSTIRTTVPLKIGQRNSSEGADGTSFQEARIYNRALSADEIERLSKGMRASYLVSRQTSLQPGEKDELFGWWLTGQDSQYRSLNAKLAGLTNEEQMIRRRGTVAHVMQEKPEPAMAYVLYRGDYDKRRDQVKPATPAALPPMPDDLPRNRLGLAKWLLRPEHPLTTRVTVNRFWQELFGNGIVKTPGDFGVTGELPTHPELLDWLAIEFRDKGWDVKKLFKLMVTSATYRQAAVVTPDKKLKDPSNKLLSRGPRFRMDAEMVRDYALAASGLLVKKIGGPSVKPYQPNGVWEAVAMIGSDTRDYKRDMGEALYRRSMYTFWKRSAPPASMEIFNAPNRETCTVRRERTNTPLQALVTLNDIQLVEAARNLAQRTLKEGGTTPTARIDFLAKKLLARPLQPQEQTIIVKSLSGLESFYKSHPKEAGELITEGESKPDMTLPADSLAAWTMLTNQMLNLDEVLNK